MNWRVVILLAVSLQIGCASSFRQPSLATVAFRVVDEGGKPLQGAEVVAGFFGSDQGGKGVTGTNGIFRIVGKAVSSLNCEVRKSGFYASHGELWDGPSEDQMVPPTNTYTVVLKKVIAPSPMVFHEVKLRLPSLDMFAGLDLEAGDWVAPNGTGIVADVFVSGWKDFRGPLDYDLRCTMKFDGPNGLLRHRHPGSQRLALKSELAPPQSAPTEGYTNSRTFAYSYRAGEGVVASFDQDDHFLFRVRTVTNETGSVRLANVGWVKSDFMIRGRRTGTMEITLRYYFNPDPHSRSLEPANLPRLPEPD